MTTGKGILYEPIEIGNVTIGNRFVRSATHEWLCEKDGTPRPELGRLLEGLAKGGVGLVTTGYAYIDPRGKSMRGQNAIHDDRLIHPYRKIVNAVHRHGAKIFMQIVHGGRQSFIGKKEYGEVVAPSAVPDLVNDLHPREMTADEIQDVIDAFANAARRVKEAGFDGLQLHAAHGFLLSSFISPYTNRRTDDWGGDLENRARMIVEILRRIRDEVGEDMVVTAKINATDGFLEDGKGLQVEDSVDIAKILAAEGLKAIEVSNGLMESEVHAIQKGIRDESLEAYFLDHAVRFKGELDIPVISVGGMRSLSVMEAAVAEGKCDMVALSRPFIREPDLVNKLRSGRSVRAECISCNQCFDETGIRCKMTMPERTAGKDLPVLVRTTLVKKEKEVTAPVKAEKGPIMARGPPPTTRTSPGKKGLKRTKDRRRSRRARRKAAVGAGGRRRRARPRSSRKTNKRQARRPKRTLKARKTVGAAIRRRPAPKVRKVLRNRRAHKRRQGRRRRS